MSLAAGLPARAADSPGDGDWPAWRRDGSGIAGEAPLPVVWSETENVLWRTELPGEGNSSPIVSGNRVFLTAALDEGTTRLVLALDAQTGKVLWKTALAPGIKTVLYPKTGFAAPTPATDGERVYAFFDAPGLVALDMQGNVVWSRRLGPFDSPYNMASSPVLYKDMVLQCCDHHGPSFLVAMERRRGEERWRMPRKPSGFGHFGTPLVIRVGGRPQVVVNGEPVCGYDPDTGKELWSCCGMKECVAPSPVFGHGVVYASSGRTGPVMAIDPAGRGNVTDTHVRMHLTSGGPYVPTPLVYPHLLVPGDNGRMLFYSGPDKLLIEDRVRDHFTASPVAGDGKIYWCSERGKTYVIDAARLGGPISSLQPPVRVLAVNQLDGGCLATPAIARGRLFLRTQKALYCIADAGSKALARSPKALSGTFAELKGRYEKHQADWQNEPEARIRLETLEAIARLDDPQVIPFLLHVAQKEPHWDLCEEAAKCLGRKNEPAIDSLIVLLPDARPFIRTIAAIELGRMKVAKAAPPLLKAVHDKQPLVRSVSFQALARIAQGPTPERPKIVAAMLDALTGRDHEEPVVRQSALDGLASLAGQVAAERPAVLRGLAAALDDRNPRLAQRAKEVFAEVYRATPAEIEQAKSRAASPPPVKVFILAGQSNMEGQAVADLDGKDYNDGKGTLLRLLRDPAKAPRLAHLRDGQGRWTVRDDVWVRYQRERGPLLRGPLSVGFAVYGGSHHFGPELQFGHVVGDHFPNQVLLIKTAWGGKSLFRDFRPPSSGGQVGPYYTKMIAEVRGALADLRKDFPAYDGGGYDLSGFVWYQGWNDGCEPKTAVPEYEANLVNLIKDVRKELKAPDLPVVIGELTGPWVEAPGEWAALRRAQAAAAARPEFRGNVLFVATREFVRKPEDSPNPGHGHHEFGNAETYFLVGDALGKGMVKLLARQ